MAEPATMLSDLVGITREGKLRPYFHSGQAKAYWSDARITLVLAGTQSG